MAHEDGRGAPVDESTTLTLGTAGHIDHGKTALVTALTGKNTDRLVEERERGISIELGYAQLTLPDWGRLSVVDVPGHERFVRAMVAGATGIDLFLLVVAADDGVMPQTVEHLAIIELLGVREGVVALTKADLVDDELLQLAAADVRELLAGGPYEQCEIVPVSARDGRGVPELQAALARAAGRAHAWRRGGVARLPVDRVFPLKGIGTVVTGTIWQGDIKPGDVLAVEPGGARTVVRSVEVHDHEAEAAYAGSRAGINLRGLGRDDISRGDWLVGPELAGHVSRRFDAWVKLLASASPLRAGARVRLHHGTAYYLARLSPLEGREISPGAEAAAIVRLDAPASVQAHDRFIIRVLSPATTIGGGEVLATGHRRWRERQRHGAFLRALHGGDVGAAVLELAADAAQSGVVPADLAVAGYGEAQVSAALLTAEKRGELEALRVPGQEAPRAGAPGASRWFVPGALAALRAAVLAGAAARATDRPQRPFSSAAELGSLVPALPAEDVQVILQGLAAEGELVAGEGGYAPAGAGVLGDAQAALADDLLARLRVDPFAPPTLATLTEAVRQPSRDVAQVLDVLARRGDVVRLDKDLWFDRAAVDAARGELEAILATEGSVTIAGFRDRLACGRRNAQALLELFDREGLTLRRGDERVPRRRRR